MQCGPRKQILSFPLQTQMQTCWKAKVILCLGPLSTVPKNGQEAQRRRRGIMRLWHGLFLSCGLEKRLDLSIWTLFTISEVAVAEYGSKTQLCSFFPVLCGSCFWRFLFFLHQIFLLNLRSKNQASAQKVPLFPWGRMELGKESRPLQWFKWPYLHSSSGFGVGGTERGKRHDLDLLSHLYQERICLQPWAQTIKVTQLQILVQLHRGTISLSLSLFLSHQKDSKLFCSHFLPLLPRLHSLRVLPSTDWPLPTATTIIIL